MTEKIYYVRNTLAVGSILWNIIEQIPCWVQRELVEMDYSKVTILARTEDIAWVEEMLAPLV